MSESVPRFGGRWTEEKVQVVSNYLAAWSVAMKKTSWRRRYIDAFSGAGRYAYEQPRNTGLPLDDEDQFTYADRENVLKVLDGVARRALEVDPPFDRVDLIEKSRTRAKELRALAEKQPPGNVVIHSKDANDSVIELLNGFDSRRERAVLFLDPFGLQVSWEALSCAANISGLDIWILFPAGFIPRLLPKAGPSEQEAWRARLRSTFGTDEWESRFYRPSMQSDLFGSPTTDREASSDAVETYMLERLEAIFEFVHRRVVRLENDGGTHMFSLCFVMTSPNKKAQDIGRRIADHIMKSAAFRRI